MCKQFRMAVAFICLVFFTYLYIGFLMQGHKINFADLNHYSSITSYLCRCQHDNLQMALTKQFFDNISFPKHFTMRINM